MNRRNFLKGVVAVVAGAVVVPAVAKKFIWRRISTVTVLDSTPDPGEVYISRNMSSHPEYEICEIIILSNGHVYKYTKAVG